VAWRELPLSASAPAARHSLVGGWFVAGAAAVFATGEGWDATRGKKRFFADAHAIVFPNAARGSVVVTNASGSA
jgi:hypothetical protein